MMNQTIDKLMITGLLSALSALALSHFSITQANADEQIRFICNQGFDKATERRLPTTYALNQGQKRALIRWVKALGGKTPQDRCQEISPRFQEAYDNQSLNIITNGTMNRQPVICTAKEYGGDCVSLLMTLRPQDNSLQILNGLKDSLSGRSIGSIRHSGGVPQVYYQIDLQEALRNAPVEAE